MKTLNSTCTPVKEYKEDTERFVPYSELPQTGLRLELGVGIPMVRSRRGIVVWEPDSDTCRFWSIEGGGTVAARDDKGRLVEAYRLKPGETVQTAQRTLEQNLKNIDPYVTSSIIE